MSSTGQARETALDLEIEEIKHADGIKKHLEWLDKLYLQDTNQSAYLACQTFEEFKRPENIPMKEYITQFEKLHTKIKAHDMMLPNWQSSPEFYIVPKKIQGWTKANSNTCSISSISWTES